MREKRDLTDPGRILGRFKMYLPNRLAAHVGIIAWANIKATTVLAAAARMALSLSWSVLSTS